MATVYETLKDRIEVNLGNVAEIAEFFMYPKQEFKNYPAVTVIPIPGEVAFETTDEDERSYKFMLTLYYPIKPGGVENAIDALYELSDKVMDEFSQDRVFENGTPISMPVGTVFLMVNPVFAGWGQVDEKDLIAAEIELNCRVSVTSSD